MVEYTLLEKIQTLFNLITNTPLFIILILGIILMVIDLTFISKKDKTTKRIYAVVSVIIIILFINSYLTSIQTIINAAFKNLISIIYFPTMLEYIATAIASLIILGISIFSKKTNKKVKKVNVFVLVLNAFLFLLIIDQISKAEVDLTNQISIYSNSVLMILLELSLGVFILWIIGLILYKIISGLKVREKEEEYVIPKLKEETIKDKKEKIVKVKKQKEPKQKEPKQKEVKEKEVKELNDVPILNDLVKEFSAMSGDKQEEKQDDNKTEEHLFTLDEYKEMSKLLDIINKQKK